MTIYEIDAEINRILDTVDENGELTEEAFEALNALTTDRDTKIENAACKYLDLVGDKKKLEEQVKILKKRIENVEHQISGIERYIRFATDCNSVKYDRVNVKFSPSETTEITDKDLFWENPDPRFVRVTTKADPNKDEIKKAIKAGEKVPGAAIISKTNMNIK